MNRVFLLDGMALAYRAYFGLIRAPRMTRGGFNTSAIFGYTSALIEILKKQNPTHMAVAFDTPEPTRRHTAFPEYKAKRDAMPEDLSASLPHIYRVTEAMGIPVLRIPGYEADDVIGTLATRGSAAGYETYMVTPDKDFAQLVDERTFFYKPARAGGPPEIKGIPEICADWNIERTDQVRDILALWGDASDNIPGVPRIGEKTAKKLIAEFGTVEGVIANSDKLKGKQRETVEAHVEQALLCKDLVTIDRDVPVDISWDELLVQEPDQDKIGPIFTEFEFTAMGKRLFGKTFEKFEAQVQVQDKKARDDRQLELFSLSDGSADIAPAPAAKLQTIDDVDADYKIIGRDISPDSFCAELAMQHEFCFDTETTGKSTKDAELVGISFSWKKGAAYYWPIPEDKAERAAILKLLTTPFADPAVTKIGHNLHYDISILLWHNLAVAGPLWDTMLAHYLLDPEGRHGLDYACNQLLNYAPVSYQDAVGDADIRTVAVESLARYACEDADLTWQLREVLVPILADKALESVFHDIECPLISVLVEMEHAGIRLDDKPLEKIGGELTVVADELRSRIFKDAGKEFNLDSPKQIGNVFFGEMKLDPKAKRTAGTGQYATGENILRGLAGQHPIVRDLLEYRQCRKLLSTYVTTLPHFIHATTGRVHTTFGQAVTATGRLQSNNPNLQNIPVRGERGRELRKAFVPRDACHTLLAADYSQIELRIVASVSEDPALCAAFEKNLDIHSATAARVFNVELEEVTSEMRRRAKTVNFGIVYGISPFGLSQRLRIPQREGKELIEHYFEKYPGVRGYIDSTIEFAREHGYVTTPLGRRRYLRDINSRNRNMSQAAERNAINAPIQGGAADMIKIAMIRVQNAFKREKFRSQLVLQVHDELVVDVHRDEREEVAAVVRQEMVHAMPLRVPIVVDMGMGKNWLDAHG